MPATRASVRRDAPTTDRVAALDALRVVSMVAVVALHASAAYMTVRIPGLIWLVHEPAGSEFVQQFAWWSYGATMPAFFALAGYAAAAVLEAKGTRGYAIDRVRRIGLPFLAALPAILVPTILIWMLGLYLAGRCTVAELLAMSFADGQIQDNRFGPAHLWFMAYLIPMLALLGVVQAWCRKRPRNADGVLHHFCSPLAPLMLAIPTTLILWLGHWWNGVDPILDLRNDFLINPIRWLHHSLFFIAGLAWHSGRTRLPALTRGPLPWLFLAGSAVALLVRVRYLPLDLAASLTGQAAWVSVASASLFGWLTLYGSLGVCAHTWHDMAAEHSSISPTPPTGCTSLTSLSSAWFRQASSWSCFPARSSSCSRWRSAWPGAWAPTRPAFAAPGLAAGYAAEPHEFPQFRGQHTSIATRSRREPWPECSTPVKEAALHRVFDYNRHEKRDRPAGTDGWLKRIWPSADIARSGASLGLLGRSRPTNRHFAVHERRRRAITMKEVCAMPETNATSEWLERARQGDVAAVAEVFTLHQQRLRRMVRLRMDRRVCGRLSPSDVLQEAYLEIARCLADYLRNPVMPLFLWMRFITARKLHALHRRHLGVHARDAGREISLHQGVFPQASSESLAAHLLGRLTSPSQAALRAELRLHVQEVLNSMDPLDREVLALRHFEQFSNAEIAQVLGLSESAASKRFVRALKRLKEALVAAPGGLDENQQPLAD